MVKGRKGYGEELKILRRYSDLSEDYFRTLKEFINSDVKEDRKFAVQQLTPAFAKMIPQDNNNNNSGEIIIKQVQYGDSNSSPIQPETISDSISSSDTKPEV